jgi:hypothetical protein
MVNGLTVSRALPDFAVELETVLHSQGAADLASQVSNLPLVDRCRCGDDFCATFYTAPKPEGAYGPGHENVVVEVTKGMTILDVVNGDIRWVEVLYRPDVQRALFAVLP